MLGGIWDPEPAELVVLSLKDGGGDSPKTELHIPKPVAECAASLGGNTGRPQLVRRKRGSWDTVGPGWRGGHSQATSDLKYWRLGGEFG